MLGMNFNEIMKRIAALALSDEWM